MRKKGGKNHLSVDRTIFWIAILILAFIGVILIKVFAGSPKTFYYEYTGLTMGTYCRIVVSSPNTNSKQLAEILFKELERIYHKYNVKDPNSFINQLNSSQGWVDLDEETFVLIDSALKFANLTNGAFDPALGNLISLWGFDKLDEKLPNDVPSSDAIQTALMKSGYKNVELDRRTRRVRLSNNVRIDLGGIAKGYALDRAYQIAKEIDPDCTGFVEVGGDIRILGPKFGSRPWVIGVRDPRKASSEITYLYLKTGAVATSGDYERFFLHNNERYHHILDPSTGYPAKGAISVTVVSENAITADALSTAGFVSAKDWEYVVQEYPKLGGTVLMVLNDGTVKKSPTMKIYERKQ